jgi:hypothetical protein
MHGNNHQVPELAGCMVPYTQVATALTITPYLCFRSRSLCLDCPQVCRKTRVVLASFS